MRIGIESQRIFRASKHGMDVVTLELLREFQRLDTVNEYTLFAREGPDRAGLHPSSNLRIQTPKAGSYAGWEQWALPRALRGSGLQLVHFTANTAPLRCPLPYVLTLHDIIYLEKTGRGGSAYQRWGNLYRRMVVPNAVRRASAIVTVSEFEKKNISEYFDLDPSRLTVVHNGVSERFYPVADAQEKAEFRARYRLPAQFLLFLGNTAPKKNTAGMIKAYMHYCELEKDPLPLVITDYSSALVENLLAGNALGTGAATASRAAGSASGSASGMASGSAPGMVSDSASGMASGASETDSGAAGTNRAWIDKIIFPGYIPYEQMPLLYNCCSLFLYPSLRESFGLPVLEAMACGTPVIASNTSAIPEVAGSAAKLVNPLDPMAIAAAIRELLGDSRLQADYRNAGLKRAAGFRWETAARKMIRLYQQWAS